MLKIQSALMSVQFAHILKSLILFFYQKQVGNSNSNYETYIAFYFIYSEVSEVTKESMQECPENE